MALVCSNPCNPFVSKKDRKKDCSTLPRFGADQRNQCGKPRYAFGEPMSRRNSSPDVGMVGNLPKKTEKSFQPVKSRYGTVHIYICIYIYIDR